MVVNGDVTQIDLPTGRRSGLIDAVEVLKGVEGISFVQFDERDVVRHTLVQRIVKAYERYNEAIGAARTVCSEACRAGDAGLRRRFSSLSARCLHPMAVAFDSVALHPISAAARWKDSPAACRKKWPEGQSFDCLITGDANCRLLNRQFRGLDHPTDVLSFPAARPAAHLQRPCKFIRARPGPGARVWPRYQTRS